MEKLPICRICLVENVRMYAVVNRDLQELYEKLTNIPFVTEDSRPMLACFFCCSKLKQCYRLLRQCLEAEELFALMMNEDYEPNPLINQDHLEFCGGFIKSPIVHISIDDECQTESIDIKEELSAVCERPNDIIEPKEEHQSDEVEVENLDNNCLDIEDILPHHSESDSEDDVPLMEFKTDVAEEVSKKKKRARETKSTYVPAAAANPLPEINMNDIRVTPGSDLNSLLTAWDMGAYIDVFNKNQITMQTIGLLNSDMIKEIIPTIGHRALFISKLENWKSFTNASQQSETMDVVLSHDGVDILAEHHKNNSQDISNRLLLSPSTSDNIVTSSPLHFENPTNGNEEMTKTLLDLLQSSVEGKHILKLHQNDGLLSSNSRRKVCNIIIKHLLGDDPTRCTNVSSDILLHYASQIKEIFIKENISDYFIPYTNNKQLKIKRLPKGKLYDCLNNRKREYREAEKTVHTKVNSRATTSNEKTAMLIENESGEPVSEIIMDEIGVITPDSELNSLLTTWDMGAYIDVFSKNQITMQTIGLLNSDMIKEIIPTIGHRALFITKLENWKSFTNASQHIETLEIVLSEDGQDILGVNHLNDNVVSQDGVSFLGEHQRNNSLDISNRLLLRPSTSDNIVTSSPLHFENPTNENEGKTKTLLNLLQSSAEGKNILKLHQNNGLLSSSSRRKVCNIIIKHLLGDDPTRCTNVSSEILLHYASQIKEIFIKENISTYFIPYINNKQLNIRRCAKGMLYICLHNRKRDYRRAENDNSYQKQ